MNRPHGWDEVRSFSTREELNIRLSRLPPSLLSCRLLPQLKPRCWCGMPRSTRTDLRQPPFVKEDWPREQTARSLDSNSLQGWSRLVGGLQSRGSTLEQLFLHPETKRGFSCLKDTRIPSSKQAQSSHPPNPGAPRRPLRHRLRVRSRLNADGRLDDPLIQAGMA